MRISYNWLKKYIDVKISPEELSNKLTNLGLEVESVENLGSQYTGFVVGEVVEVQKHPNADRLTVCRVKVERGKEPQQVVCGAPNVSKGQKVIVGLAGATIPKNQHDPNGKPFTLSKVSLRGVESNGMICSEYELGLGDDKSGIKVLDAHAKVGTSLAEYLGVNDTAFEIGITPNRPDCLSHIGIARDVAAAYKKKYARPVFKLRENKKLSIYKLAKVKVEDTHACPRYSARLIENVKVQESPSWLKNFLSAAGLRPINNIVDITNFVMLEYGQPLHAFDYDALAQHTIVVKNAKTGDRFTTLDGKDHQLDGTELMICDGKKAVALAGVMGGLNSEISRSTKSVLLECAYFSPVSIRKTAKKLGISTEASYRFERGTDPNIVIEASARAASLIAELSGGEVAGGCIDVYPKKISPKKISLRTERVNDILGTSISTKQISDLLNAIEIKTQKGKRKASFVCHVPTFRPDIEQEIDLIEEIARHYGYDNINNQIPGDVIFTLQDKKEAKINEIRNWFESNGFNEIMTNSLIDNSLAASFSDKTVKVRNPLTIELEVLRPSLLPTMLQSVSHNYNHGAAKLHFFEIGTVFSSADLTRPNPVNGYSEQNMLGICMSGDANQLSWNEKLRPIDLYDLKGVAQSLFTKLGLDNIHLICYDASKSLTESAIDIEINNTYVGFIGKCKKIVLEKFKIEKDVYFAEINLDLVTEFEVSRKFSEFSKFPTVIRDVAFLLRNEVTVQEIEDEIRKAGGKLITEVTVFDIFSGKALGEGQKSVAFSLKLNSGEKTLSEEEIEKIISNIVHAVQSTFGAVLRSI
ncbi:MAG: phenylalanine--tRNA ligase subunit beta [Bacteroidota bacterium]|nr:phenylalanine--tRNA ligase subunit beta [Bacteroidota bacterium]